MRTFNKTYELKYIELMNMLLDASAIMQAVILNKQNIRLWCILFGNSVQHKIATDNF